MAAKKKSVRGVTVANLRPFIEWLDSKQDPEAYVTQFGVGRKVGDFRIYIAPHGPANATATGGSVLVFNVLEDVRKYKGVEWDRELTNGITRKQRDALEALVEELTPVHAAWNGESARTETCSFHVAKDTGPDVARAYKNYSDRPGVTAPIKRPFVLGLDGEKREE